MVLHSEQGHKSNPSPTKLPFRHRTDCTLESRNLSQHNKATDCTNDKSVQIAAEADSFLYSILSRPGYGAHPTSYLTDTGTSIPGHDVDHSPLSSAEVNNVGAT